jgi:hypothetical protein
MASYVDEILLMAKKSCTRDTQAFGIWHLGLARALCLLRDSDLGCWF